MLVLSRQRNERVVITDKQTNESLTVEVTDVLGEKVRLGFTASKRFIIDREEVHASKLAQTREGPNT